MQKHVSTGGFAVLVVAWPAYDARSVSYLGGVQVLRNSITAAIQPERAHTIAQKNLFSAPRLKPTHAMHCAKLPLGLSARGAGVARQARQQLNQYAVSVLDAS